MRSVALQLIAAIGELAEHGIDFRVPNRPAGLIDQQVLFRHIGDISRLGVLGEQMIVGLFLGRPDILGDRQPPLLGIVEARVDIEDHAAKREQAVADTQLWLASSMAKVATLGRFWK